MQPVSRRGIRSNFGSSSYLNPAIDPLMKISLACLLRSLVCNMSQKSTADAVKKILIVEDNNASREILVLRLRSMGYTVKKHGI
jgi:hypothetical protein